MPRAELVRQTVQAAMAFHERRLWERFTNFDCFAVRIRGREDLVLGTVMGDAGEEFGLNLLRGPNAVQALKRLTSGKRPSTGMVEAMDLLGYSVDRYCDLTDLARAWFRNAGLRPKRREWVPGFIVKPPHRQPRLPDEADLELFLLVLRAAVQADRMNLLQPAELDDSRGISVISVAEPGDAENLAITVTCERLSQRDPTPDVSSSGSAPLDFTRVQRTKQRWLVATPRAPMRIVNDDRSMRVLLILDERDDQALEAFPFSADKIDEALTQLVTAIHDHGLPSRMLFDDPQFLDAMKDSLRQAGVQAQADPNDLRFEVLAQEFFGHADEMATEHAEPVSEPAVDETELPAIDDLQGWKQADQRVAQRIGDYLDSGNAPYTPRAIKRYFNGGEMDRLFVERARLGIWEAYASWCVVDYRPTKTSQTYAEILLARGLPPAQEALLRARQAAWPSLHRVAGSDPEAGTVTLEDVMVGGITTVHDRLLAQNIDRGVFLAARVYSAGQFHFIEMIGPPLGPGMGMEAVTFLHDNRLAFNPAALKASAHMFGWLWAWLDDREANWQPPELRNLDGDDLILHTATFAVADTGAVVAALKARPDIDYDEDAGQYVWSKPTDQTTAVHGDFITLARIELIGDELVLSVNSARRLAAARQWIDLLPGVSFIDVSARPIDPSGLKTPMDDRMPDAEPAELDPEIAARLQERIAEQYMRWLDTPLPILAGKTPRQACATPGGREQVTLLIRTMPDPTGSAVMHVPREEMLRELGLPAGPAPSSDTTAAAAQVVPQRERRIRRNAPCPCGSGRKYRKCCGR